MSDVVEIYDARDEPEALLLSQRLQEAGIEAWIAGESLGAVHGGGFAGPMNRVTVVVNSLDAQRARHEIENWNPCDTGTERHRPSAHIILVVTLPVVATAFGLVVLLTRGQLQSTLLALLFWMAATVVAALGIWRRRRR